MGVGLIIDFATPPRICSANSWESLNAAITFVVPRSGKKGVQHDDHNRVIIHHQWDEVCCFSPSPHRPRASPSPAAVQLLLLITFPGNLCVPANPRPAIKCVACAEYRILPADCCLAPPLPPPSRPVACLLLSCLLCVSFSVTAVRQAVNEQILLAPSPQTDGKY